MAVPISGSEAATYDWIDRFVDTWLQTPAGMRIGRGKFPEPCIDICRDKAVATAIQNGAKWLFFLDADVIPPPDVIPRLLRHNLPIVAGLYIRRHNPPFNEMLRFRTDGMAGLRPIQEGEYTLGTLVECDAVGTGCLLISTEVFETMKPFQVTIDGQPARPSYFLWTEFRLQNGMSEDFSWCVKARQSGFKIFCDTSIQCRHRGMVNFAPGGVNGPIIEF